MPEGDTVAIVAARIRPLVLGKPLRHVALRRGRGERFGPPKGPLLDLPELRGAAVDGVEPHGKHLVLTLGRRAIHVHLGMSGSWHRYDLGAAWQRPEREVGVWLGTETDDVLCFSPPIVGFGHVHDVRRELSHLGPDLLGPTVDWDAVLANALARPELAMQDALLDQRIAAGIGNEYKNELLFLFGLHPERPVGSVPSDVLAALFVRARELMQANLGGGRRSTTGASGPQRVYVYGRSGQPCGTCGARLHLTRHGQQLRTTTWCPTCQPAA